MSKKKDDKKQKPGTSSTNSSAFFQEPLFTLSPDVRKKILEEDTNLNSTGFSALQKATGFRSYYSPAFPNVGKLLIALNDYTAKDKLNKNVAVAAQYMFTQLQDAIIEHNNHIEDANWNILTGDLKDKVEIEQRRFEAKCVSIINENIKYVIAEPSLWNVIKDGINDLLRTISVEFRFKLDKSELHDTVIADVDNIKAQMKNVQYPPIAPTV